MGDLFNQIYFGKSLIPAAEREQDEFYYRLENLKKYDPKTNGNISIRESFLKNKKSFYDGREMVINAFKNKIIPPVDGSYSQYFEEADTDWIEKPETFKKELDSYNSGFNVNFDQKNISRNISIIEMKKIVDDIDSGKINNKRLQWIGI